MDQALQAAYDASRKLDDKPFRCGCYAPYASMYFHTNGDVVACCKNTSYVLGNVGQERLADIWRGRRATAMRKALRQYNFNLGCQFCEWQIEGRQFDQVYAKTTFDIATVTSEEPEWPSMMEFTVSNTCNLACIMCYGELSSTIRSQRDKLPPLPKVYGDQFFADLRPFLSHLKRAKFFGGEPFLAQENYRIWEMMEQDKVRIPILITTNGTQWNSRVEHILDTFPWRVSISVDGATKATAESIRLNTHFETVIANVDRFIARARSGGGVVSLTYCLMRQNWHEFGDYLVFGEVRDAEIFVNTVVDPKDCSLYTLPVQDLLAIVTQMEAQDRERGYSKLPRNGKVWQAAIETLRHNAREQQVQGVGEVLQAAAHMREKMRPDYIKSAWAFMAQGKLQEAIAEAQKMPEADSRTYEARTVEAHALRRLGRLDEAEALLLKLIEQWRRSPTVHIELAWLRIEQKRFHEALEEANAAETQLSAKQAATIGPGITNVVAHALVALGRKDEAVQRLRQLPVDDRHAFDSTATIAWLCRDLGRHAEAEEALDRLEQMRPGAVRTRIERAWLCLHQNRLEDAYRNAADACQRIDADQDRSLEVGARHVLAVSAGRTERLAEALQAATRLTQLRPGSADFQVLLARGLWQTGRADEARAALQRALSVAADHGEAKALLARYVG